MDKIRWGMNGLEISKIQSGYDQYMHKIWPNLAEIWPRSKQNIWSRYGSDMVQIWSRYGQDMVKIWSR